MPFQVGFVRTSDWGAGFVAQVTIRPEAALDGWTLAFDAGFAIGNIWGAEIVSQANGRVVLRNAPWNAQIPAGTPLSFGFQAATPSPAADPTGFVLAGPSLPSVSVADVTTTEDAGFAVFRLTLSEPAVQAVTVGYATNDDTARAGQDYVAATGRVTFAAGETSATIRVALTNDRGIEPSERFGLVLADPSGATIADGTASATILDDDAPRITIADTGVREGDTSMIGLRYTIRLSQAAADPVTVRFATADGTATAGEDYRARQGLLTFAAGETEKIVVVAVRGDTLGEANESVLLRLADATGATIEDAEAIGIIRDDDAPAISVSNAVVREGARGASFLDYTISLSHAATRAVSVRFETADGSATAGSDYVARAGILYFAPGQTEKVIRVAVLGDLEPELHETVLLRLSDPTRATILDSEGVGTIRDDDMPTISVSDAVVTEGDFSQIGLHFTVSLSHASARAVSLRWTTADGTALVGEDYKAREGMLHFAPGQTEKTITIAVRGDTRVEADETVFFRIADATRATIADAEAVGTIVNDDLPRISIADAAPVTEGDAGEHVAIGVLSTRGGDIIDATGTPVRVAAVNWFGMETDTFAPHGLHTRSLVDMLRQIADTGFNAIRLPFSAQAILDGGRPQGIDWHLNPDLVGLTSIQLLDKIIEEAGNLGLRIMLDHHRSAAGNGPNGNGLWYSGAYTEDRWVEMWEMLAERYRGNPTVIGADLSNEPHGATWDAWATAAERAGNAVLAKNPDWLIFVEGVGQHDGQNYWWGGNLLGVRDRPVVLDVPGKLVYSPHDYPNSIYPQPFFQGSDFPENMPAIFDRMWGYIWREGIAPILVGEFGSRLADPKDQAWADKIIAFIGGDLDADGDVDMPGPGASHAWWSWNPNSGDTGGILADDWRTVLTSKLDELAPIMPGEAAPLRRASFEVTLSEAAAQTLTVGWRTIAGAAGDEDFVAASGILTFLAGQSRQSIEVLLRADEVAEADEWFGVELFAPTGATIADAFGLGRILDDDGAAARQAVADWAM